MDDTAATTAPRPQQAQGATITLSILVALYAVGFSNLFLRGSLGILGPDLTREMHLTPAMLSAVASSFFFAYAAMQLPTGMLLDRFGPRFTLSALLLFTTAGAALFALSESAGGLIAARVLMGIGCAGSFTGAFYVLNRWVPAHKVVTQSGILNSISSVGALCATTPLAALVAWIGWRDSYWLFTAGVLLLVVTVGMIVRDAPPGQDAPSSKGETLGHVFRGVADAMRQPGMMRMIVVGVPLAAQPTLLGAWAAPYLRDVYALDSIARGNVLLVMAVCSMFGHVIYGFLARTFNTIKWVIVGGMCLILVSTAVLAILPKPPLTLVIGLFAVIAISAMYPMMAFAHSRGLVPPHLVGRGLAVTNTGIMTAIAVSQMLFGTIVGLFPTDGTASPDIAYRAGFAMLSGLALLAVVIYAPVRDSRPKG